LVELLQHFSSEAHMYAVVRINQAIPNRARPCWYQGLAPEALQQHLGALSELVEEFNRLTPANRRLTSEAIIMLNRVYGDVPNVRW